MTSSFFSSLKLLWTVGLIACTLGVLLFCYWETMANHVLFSHRKLANHGSHPSSANYKLRGYNEDVANTGERSSSTDAMLRWNPCLLLSPNTTWSTKKITRMGPHIERDCHKLRYAKSNDERGNYSSQIKVWQSNKPWITYAERLKNMSCSDMRKEFMNNFYVSEMENNFPIAYIFVVYTNPGQILRLLKTIYRPHNVYCVSPDAKQGDDFKAYFTGLSKCLNNVFVVSKPVNIYYRHISITDAQLHCMQDLENYSDIKWNYVINLCGREIPLKTNREIVESLQKLNGYSLLNLRNLSTRMHNERFKFKWHLSKGKVLTKTNETLGPPPSGIKIYKSMNFIASSRAFVHFLLHNPISHELYKYLIDVMAPEEHFYSTLYALPQAEGARPLKENNYLPVVDRYIWLTTPWKVKHKKKYCPGLRVVHDICILTVAEMGIIQEAIDAQPPNFFFNKYFLEWDPIPMECMEERLIDTNMDEYRRDCLGF